MLVVPAKYAMPLKADRIALDAAHVHDVAVGDIHETSD